MPFWATLLCGHFFWIRPYITHSYKYILVCITVQFRLYWYDECLNNHINTYCLYCISNSNRYLRIVILNAMEKEEIHRAQSRWRYRRSWARFPWSAGGKSPPALHGNHSRGLR